MWPRVNRWRANPQSISTPRTASDIHVNITRVPGWNPGPYTGAGNHTYLIHGREPTLIDAATGDPRHLAGVARALGSAPLARLLVTHAHADHISGSQVISERWPAAQLVKMPWPARDGVVNVTWHAISDGQEIAAGDQTLWTVHTPGHAPDHLCFWHPDSRTLFSGDMVVQGGTIVIPASRGGDLAQYLLSLQRMLALKPVRLLPAHGPEVSDPLTLIQTYLDHRRRRDDEIVDAVRNGHSTCDAIVMQIYSGLPDDRHPMAVESVKAHLIKLRNEERVSERDDRWYPA